MNDRTAMVAPKPKKSSTESDDPNETLPRTDSVEAIRAKDLRAKEAPI
jgi:hypothetical protein